MNGQEFLNKAVLFRLNFDANWYRYLYDDSLKEGYKSDRKNTVEAGVEGTLYARSRHRFNGKYSKESAFKPYSQTFVGY